MACASASASSLSVEKTQRSWKVNHPPPLANRRAARHRHPRQALLPETGAWRQVGCHRAGIGQVWTDAFGELLESHVRLLREHEMLDLLKLLALNIGLADHRLSSASKRRLKEPRASYSQIRQPMPLRA